ncbi:hypothetical protein P4S72_17275 [Vibrio sp. PP-XX7]
MYTKEYYEIDKLSQKLCSELDKTETIDFEHIGRLKIYRDCMKVAFFNDLKSNRAAKISEDERTILNVLSERLMLSKEEVYAIEHSINPIPELGIETSLDSLRESGIILVSRRRSEIMIADEVVDIIHGLLGKELADKYVLRILRSLSDAELSLILKSHEHKVRGISRKEKIFTIAHMGLSIRSILSNDIHPVDSTQNERKDRIKQLIEDMSLNVQRIGTRLQDRIDVLIQYLKDSKDEEFNTLSVSGYKELLECLSTTSPTVEERIRADFEIENKEILDPEKLKALGITPFDVLYLYDNEEIKLLRNEFKLSKRGNPRTQIIERFASANDKLIENYHLLACRDLPKLISVGIDIREADIGVKFEEVTRSILEQLGMMVDEDLRKRH